MRLYILFQFFLYFTCKRQNAELLTSVCRRMQQHFIIAATFKAITASFFIMKQVLFVSKKII